MVRIRIRGLVRAARRAQAQLGAGLPRDEGDLFVDGVRCTVARADELLAAHGAPAEALPVPSRRALSELRRIARLDPRTLPPPVDGEPSSRRPVRVRNAVATLRRILDDMDEGRVAPRARSTLRRDAETAAGAIEGACIEAGSSPAGLPPPSRNAFAMLRWKHGVRMAGARRHAHTPAFKADERIHPRLAEAERWIAALAAGVRRPEGRPAQRAGELSPADVTAPRVPTPPQRPAALAADARPGRNEPCWCGSARKYKRCHLAQDEG
jgi:hypothetical protein